MKIEEQQPISLTLEIPAEIEAKLRAVAAQEGDELGTWILAAALEKAERAERRASQRAGLEEVTRINEELGLYQWKLEDADRDARR